MEAWVRSKVELLGLDADVYVEYGRSILEDEDMDVEERVQSVVSIFSSAADRLVDDALLAKHLDEPEMVAAVRGILEGTKQQQEQAEELKRAEIAMRDMQLREQEKRQAELFREKELEKARARQNMTPEELAAREKLISAYGFSAISEFDEDGNIVKMADKDKTPANLENVGANTNKARVHQAQADMRVKMKGEHEKKTAREKELLEKDRLRKDKAKKRTVKREKQRGAG